MTVAVLFAAADSIYKTMPECDVYDAERDARSYVGNDPVIAHPPCRTWSRLRAVAKAPPGESELAFIALNHVRRCGGILEHPASSKFWRAADLPAPGCFDQFGGFTLAVQQHDFGHRARKNTWLYIVGVHPGALPRPGLILGEPSHTLGLWSGRDRRRARPEVSKKERSATPAPMAAWLIDVARRARPADRPEPGR